MVAPCQLFHQSVFAIPAVQMKRAVNQYGAGNNAEQNTGPLIYARHKQRHKHDKQPRQPACEYEQVLTFKSLKLRRMSYSPVNWKLRHFLSN